MKKRLILALALVLTISFTVGALVGCDEIFKKNDERDAKQIVATVTYGNQTATVTKGELTASFNSYAYTYVNYYGLTYQETADYIVKSLAQRELLVLFAKDEITKAYVAAGKLPAGSVPELVTLEQLLTKSEISKAIDETNSDMNSSLASIIEDLVLDDSYNNAEEDEEEETVEVTDPVKVRFESLGGSDVETVTVQKGQKATQPSTPTYSGYAFYGWYTQNGTTSGDWGVKFDFENTAIDKSVTLYAKWVETLTARATMPEEEEEDDYDPDSDDVTVSERFFDSSFNANASYVAKIKSKEIELDIDTEIADEDFATYVDRGIAELKKNITSNYRDYDYYLNSEMKTILITKLERYIGNEVSVDAEEVNARFAKLVKDNEESFGASESSYSDALTKSLSTTYFHKVTVDENGSGYGFVQNILLKLSQEDTDYLVNLVKEGTMPTENILTLRDKKLSAIKVNVSNPSYDPDAEVNYGDDVTIVDPMTDPANPYNDYSDAGKGGKTPDATYQKEGGNNYANILSFGKDADGKFGITYNVSECPSMPYMIETVPALGENGIVEQIYASFESVKAFVTANELTYSQGIYWLNKVATAWVYLVGDDGGMTSSDSNNNGLGYLITPDGEDSSYLSAFTDLARGLIKQGAGAYSIDGTATEGNFYCFADSFIESGSTSNAYAGIFVLVCSYKAWDAAAYNACTGNTLTANEDGSGVLPSDYVLSYGATDDENVTVGEQVEKDLLEGKQTDRYNQKANNMGLKYADTIQYHEKAYKSLWKDLD